MVDDYIIGRMKKALILHGTGGSSQANWFPWLTTELEKSGFEVWCPDLPEADTPSIERYNQYILEQAPFQFDKDTIFIGHSSGAVAILGLLEALPVGTKVQACYLVGSFKNDLGWDSLKQLFVKPFDFEQIKTKSRLWYFLHSDNDPHCPLEQAEYLHSQIGGDLIVLPGQKHFSVGTAGLQYKQFPYLLHVILGDTMTADDVLEIYQDMEQQHVTLWLDGGWGVDALLEKQTRAHGDLDIAIQKKDVRTMVEHLKSKGYWLVHRGDATEHNFIMGNGDAQFVDFHVIELDAEGNGVYGPKENGVKYAAEALSGKGKVQRRAVRCISPEWVVKFHSGYELRDKDIHDVLAICEKFDMSIPDEVKSLNKVPKVRFALQT